MRQWQRGQRGQEGQRWQAAHRGSFALLALLPLLAACGGAKAKTASKPTMRDSAGVTIVENTAPAWRKNGGWTLTPQPTVSIGVLNGAPEYQLFRVSGAVRLSDGTIVVANSGTEQLRYFDSTGHLLENAGREGGGPGEFRLLQTIFRIPGDTVAAFDLRLRRVSLFTKDGTFARSVDVSSPGNSSFPFPIGAFGDGSILVYYVTIGFAGSPKSGVRRDSVTYVRTDGSDHMTDTIGKFLGTQTLVAKVEKMAGIMPLAFGRASFMQADDSLVVFGANDTYAFQILDRHGHVRRIIRRAYELPPVTDDEIAEYKKERLGRYKGDDLDRRFAEGVLEQTPFPKTFPAYRSFQVDALGNVWVQAYTAPGDSSNVWTVFNTDGWMLGPVTFPRGFEARDIGADYVLGLWKDENDVEHVMEYGLRKPEAPGKEGA